MSRKVFAVVVSLAIALGFGIYVASAAAASADDPVPALGCTNHDWQPADGTLGQGNKDSGIPIRPGPHSTCGALHTTNQPADFTYHCYTMNESNNTWTHVYHVQSNTLGWVYDGHLYGGGSWIACEGQPDVKAKYRTAALH